MVTLSAVTLHNVLRTRNPTRYIPAASIDQENSDGTIRRGNWRDTPDNIAHLSTCPQRNATLAAKQNRIDLTEYFATVGAVPWQDRVLEVVRKRRKLGP